MHEFVQSNECEDITCGDNLSNGGRLFKAVKAWVGSLVDSPTYGSDIARKGMIEAWGNLVRDGG